MRILWLNWRDIKNPESGGAEVMTHETAKRLVKGKNDVTLFTAKYPDSKDFEVIDGVKIIRRGNRLTCRIFAWTYYRKNFRGNVDFVIDEINTIPFFTNFYVQERKVALIHQLAREYWWSEIFFPINLLGYLLEPFYLKLYRNIPTVVASNSTKSELQKLGFKKIDVFYQGLSVNPQAEITKKPKGLKILFLGRLTRPKGPQDAILAFKKISDTFKNCQLVIVGKGKSSFIDSLKKITYSLKLQNKVNFKGFVNQEEKIKLLKEAKIILVPSAREGWNLVPIEANSFGVVPVGYNVPGLRDSIKNNQTGILTYPNPNALAKETIRLLKDPELFLKLSQNGLLWAKNFSWDKTYDSFVKIISKIPLKILWLSWRDIKNPDAGGAERVAIETASRFVKNGTKVTIFTSTFKGAMASEKINGVEIIRHGNLLTCRLQAFFYHLKNRYFNLIIDEINTIPFFSVLYTPNKTVALVHQLAREYWFTQTIWPINRLGYFLEPYILKLYRNRPTIVVSKSTQLDLQKLGFKNIKVAREGLDFAPQANNVKSNLILFIGRLTAAKGPQDAITSFSQILKEYPSARLSIIGHGDEKFTQSLKRLAKKLKIKNRVSFEGFVTQKQKIALLRDSKITLIPSVREGWNLVATEANATDSVPIAYNVPGLRDSIKNHHNGILTPTNPQSMAEAALKVLQNESLRKKLAQNGLKFAQKFSWNNTYEDVKQFIFARRTPRPAGMNAHKRIHTFEG